jgi:hypothetical protein
MAKGGRIAVPFWNFGMQRTTGKSTDMGAAEKSQDRRGQDFQRSIVIL